MPLNRPSIKTVRLHKNREDFLTVMPLDKRSLHNRMKQDPKVAAKRIIDLIGGINMRVKVIIRSGIATEVLTDGEVELEVVDIDKDYEDYDKLRAYEEELHKDASLRSVDFTVAHFE